MLHSCFACCKWLYIVDLATNCSRVIRYGLYSVCSLCLSLDFSSLKESLIHFQKEYGPPKDVGDLTISGNLKSFEGPVLNCRDITKHRSLYLNELVVHEIRNNASAVFFSQIEFVQLW